MKRIYFLYTLLFFSVLLLLDSIMYFGFDVSFAGYHTDYIIFWLSIIFFLICVSIYWEKIIAKIGLAVFVLGIIASIIPMMIPFWAIVLSMSNEGLMFEKNINDKYSFRVVNYSPMDFPKGVIIENKYLLFEKEIKRDIKFSGIYSLDITDFKIIKDDKNTIIMDVFYKSEYKSYYEPHNKTFRKTIKIEKNNN